MSSLGRRGLASDGHGSVHHAWRIAGLVTLFGPMGCAEGTPETFRLESGVYELSTVEVAGNCAMEDAITPGSEFEGKIARVGATTSSSSVKLEACDDFFDDRCEPEPFLDPITLLRDDFDLRASDETWEVPGCFCLEDYRGSRRVDGVVTDDGQAELTWSFDIPGPPTNCTCDTTACTLEIRQRLLREDLLTDG